YSRRLTLMINAFSALASTISAVITFWLGSQYNLPVGVLLAVTAGMFIYIASSDLIPIVHEQSRKKSGHLTAALFLVGIVVVWAATNLAHGYIDVGHELSQPHSATETIDHHD